MKLLVIGGGGREHALCWRLRRSPLVKELFATPGNPGIAQLARCLPAGDGRPQTFLEIANAADADLTIVGPEAPLVAGVADLFRAQGRLIFGPSKEAAQLEGSKIYAKRFFQRHRIPTADFVTCQNAAEARRAVARFGYPVVLKADGLAAGKGVVILREPAGLESALGDLQGPLVVEQFLEGEEISCIVLSDGRNFVPLAPAQDHKAVNDNDTGPNTGGMGAYSDSRLLSERATAEILERIIEPTIEATHFTGFLYAGLMLTAAGPKILEFNVRMGDPETQPLMLRLESDLAAALVAGARGDLAGTRLEWNPGAAVCVVLASRGYPGPYSTGAPIHGIEDAGEVVFHAGTRIGESGLETAGGRVLGVTALGNDLPSAIAKAYTAVRRIHFDGMHYRTDIGRKGLSRYNEGVSQGTAR
jgi:phosphoribosylamine--glycine ligase